MLTAAAMRVVPNRRCRTFYRAPYALGHHHPAIDRGVWQQDGKLFSARGLQIGLAQVVADGGHKVPQHLVTGGVPMGVVHALEVVKACTASTQKSWP